METCPVTFWRVRLLFSISPFASLFSYFWTKKKKKKKKKMRCGFLLPPLLHLCEYIRVSIRRNYPCYRSHPRILLRLLSLRCQHSEWYHSLLLMLLLLVLPHPRLYITQIQRERAISSTLSRYSSSASFHLYVFHRHTVCTGIFYSSLRLMLLIYCVNLRVSVSLFFSLEISSSFFIHHTNKIFCSTRMMMMTIII